jgi:hypothetical protein
VGYNKFQGLGFRTTHEFLDYLTPHELEVVDKLRELILETIPNVTEKLSYNVPYYYRNRRICFIWPPSVPWGKVPLNGVMLGMCEGHLLKDHHYFTLDNRKQVATRSFDTVTTRDLDLIRSYLFEAIEIDNSFALPKR